MRLSLLAFTAASLMAGSTLAQMSSPEPINSRPLQSAQAPMGGTMPMQAAPMGQQPGMQQPGMQNGQPPAPPTGGGGMGLGKVFEEADTNHDNVVTREEFLAKAERHFGMADTNKDGKITREEMQSQQTAMMQQMQKNLMGGGNWQEKMSQFMNGGQQPQPQGQPPQSGMAPTAPGMPPINHPSAPMPPSTQQPVVIP